jgi:peptidyl-prolyl cis-trans isomerase B (cyclophilin B)
MMRQTAPGCAFFEPLESRIVLDATPFPSLGALENPLHAVARIQTLLGAIDVELFGTGGTAPTAAAFTQLLRAGAYGETFFHRSEPNLALGAGRFRFDDVEGLTQREGTVPTAGGAVRSNLERTLAMPLPGLLVPISRGDFIINLNDNSALLDQTWAVFGRVVQGWDVVQQIAALPTADLSGTFAGPGADQLTDVPLLDGQVPATREQLVMLADVQLIKPAGVEDFYIYRIFYPEGYSWERVAESIELSNPNAEAAQYQVLVRYERGERDQVIATGELGPQLRTSLVVSPGLAPSQVVRDNVPYAYEVWSTAAVAADLRHQDFNRPTRESFFNPAALPSDLLMQEWTFNQAAFGLGPSNVFLVWQNTTEFETDITVTFYFEDAEPQSFVFNLGPFRRGGLNLLDFEGLPATEEFVGAQVTADVPIVASITRYDRRPGVPLEVEGGVSALGTFGGGSTVGIAPGARRGPVEPLTILNTTSEAVTVSFVMTPRPGATSTLEVVIPANRFIVLEGQASPTSRIPAGREYTISYQASAPVTVGFVTSAFRGTGTAFATWAAQEIHFGDASVYVAPAGSPFGLTAVSVYNPAATAADVGLAFRFNTGPAVETFPGTWVVPTGTTVERRINEFNNRISQVRGGISELTARSLYSLEVFSSVPVVAQMRLLHGEGRTELGMPLSPMVLLGETAIPI